jgi:hypothetical protein
MKRFFVIPVVALSLLSMGLMSCNDFGKRVKVEGTKGEVFYKEGVTEDEAKKVGDVLKDGFLGNEKAASLQVTKQNDEYTVRFVYDRSYYEKNPQFEKEFRDYASRISKEVFDGKKVNVALADEQFRDFKTFPFAEESEAKTEFEDSGLAPPAPTAGPVESVDDYSHETRGDVNFFWKGMSDSDSKTIMDYIVQNGAFNGGTAHLYMNKVGDRYTIQFPVKEEYRDNAAIIAEVDRVSREIKENVFPNNPFTFEMTDVKLVAFKSFDY